MMKVIVRVKEQAGYGKIGDEKEVDFPIVPIIGDVIYVDEEVARFVGGRVQTRYISNSGKIILEV